MDLLSKIETAATSNADVTLSPSEAREIYARLMETEIELHETRLTLDHVADVFGAKRSKAVN